MKTLKQYQYFVLAILTFIGIIFYEININPAQFLTQLFADSRSFAILVKDDEFVLLDQKTRFVINQNETERQFMFLDYDTGMINGEFDIHSINEITVIQGNKAVQLGKTGLKAGVLGGFLLGGVMGLSGGEPIAAIPVSLMCGAIDGVALGAAGSLVGSRIPNITTYKVASNHWQFADINNLILK